MVKSTRVDLTNCVLSLINSRHSESIGYHHHHHHHPQVHPEELLFILQNPIWFHCLVWLELSNSESCDFVTISQVPKLRPRAVRPPLRSLSIQLSSSSACPIPEQGPQARPVRLRSVQTQAVSIRIHRQPTRPWASAVNART